jgi:hypothetical protein
VARGGEADALLTPAVDTTVAIPTVSAITASMDPARHRV